MKNKKIWRTFTALCAALVLMGGFSVTAFAQGTEQPPETDATRNSSCPGISPRCCLAHIIAKSYHFRTVIQLSRCTRENIPQGVTFKTPIFVRFFKTFFKKLKVCSVAQKRPSLGRHFESLKKRLFLKLFYFRLNCTTKKAVT